MDGYPEAVSAELKRLTRRLFVEKFEETGLFKRNMEVVEVLREGLSSIVGVGPGQEILMTAIQEIGTPAKFMKEKQWRSVLDRIVQLVREQAGDVEADRVASEWGPKVDRILKSFV
jgi:hypothetical protein